MCTVRRLDIMESTLTCKLCLAASHLKFNVTDYIKHIKIFHAFKPDFKVTCRINGCPKSYSNLGTFLNHVSGVHSVACIRTTGTIPAKDDTIPAEDDTVHLNEDDEDYDNDIPGNDDTNLMPTNQHNCEDNEGHFNLSQELMQRSLALCLLGLKEKCKLTQVLLQGVVQCMTGLNQQHANNLKAQVCA